MRNGRNDGQMNRAAHQDPSRRSSGRSVLFAEKVGSDGSGQIVARVHAQRRVLVEGSFLSEDFGYLQVEGGCTRELVDAVTTAMVKPGVYLTIVLGGEVRFAYDGSAQVLKVDPRCDPENGSPQAVAVNLGRLTVFRRHIRRAERGLSKLQLRLDPGWLRRGEANDPLRRRLALYLLDHHLSALPWQPDSSALAQCWELLELRQESDRLRRSLRAEALAHQVLGHFLDHLGRLPLPGNAAQAAVPQPLSSTERTIAWLENHLDQPLRMEEVAQASAMSVSALQRHFRRDTGLTVFEYVRGRRLDRVRDALRQEALSVSEAAYMAGYSHTSNFITAFRRRFGITPGEVSAGEAQSLAR